jgi:hypothetical protein
MHEIVRLAGDPRHGRAVAWPESEMRARVRSRGSGKVDQSYMPSGTETLMFGPV